jgi:hypothetical protein
MIQNGTPPSPIRLWSSPRCLAHPVRKLCSPRSTTQRAFAQSSGTSASSSNRRRLHTQSRRRRHDAPGDRGFADRFAQAPSNPELQPRQVGRQSCVRTATN